MFGYSLNTISNVLNEFSKKASIYKQKMSKINIYMQNRGLNKCIQQKVRKYIQYQLQEELNSSESPQQDLDLLPQSIREEVYQDIYGKVLRVHKLFRFNFSEGFLSKIAVQMKEIRLGPGEVFIRQGERCENLYFLITGQVDIYQENSQSQTLVETLSQQGILGV